MKLFGFEIKKKKEENIPSIVPPSGDDGSTIVTSSSTGALGEYYSVMMDIEGSIKNDNDLIRRYREAALYPDCDTAIDDIVNEAIVVEENEPPVGVNLENTELPDSIINKIRDEFDTILKLFKVEECAHEMFRNWYIDGRILFYVMIDENNIKKGINEIRYMDPRKVKKVKNVKKERQNGVEVVTGVEEYYIYNDKGISEKNAQGIKISKDSVIYSSSGITDGNSGMVISYLHKAIKAVNQLKMMEDALVIYRISRAPERRIFYIDVGNLPKIKAEQYVSDLMNKYRNKIVYDATTGEVRDDKKHMNMLEDFWMPRREGGKGTEITTLQGGQTLGQIEDVQYFQQKLYQSLNVPISRLQPQTGFSLGRSAEISREEVKFGKFIDKLRKRFSKIFLEALRIQVISKGIMNPDDWDEISGDIRFDFKRDNYFSEFKESELLGQRLTLLQQIDLYVGKYYSKEWVSKNVLRLGEEEIKEIEKEIKANPPAPALDQNGQPIQPQ